jgi:RHS repeat-associated protein
MQGQYDDGDTGLYYNTFRYYDADAGRFTTEDPIGLAGGMNLYQYAPNPLRWADPLGLRSWVDAYREPEFDDISEDESIYAGGGISGSLHLLIFWRILEKNVGKGK